MEQKSRFDGFTIAMLAMLALAGLTIYFGMDYKPISRFLPIAASILLIVCVLWLMYDRAKGGALEKSHSVERVTTFLCPKFGNRSFGFRYSLPLPIFWDLLWAPGSIPSSHCMCGVSARYVTRSQYPEAWPYRSMCCSICFSVRRCITGFLLTY